MKKTLNRYEKKIMLNLHIITFLCIFASVLNFILPAVEIKRFSIFILTQFLAVGFIYIYGWFNSRNLQGIPIASTFIIRSIQALIFVLWRRTISWISFGVLVFLDILLIIILALDKASYKYEFIAREDDEFFDS